MFTSFNDSKEKDSKVLIMLAKVSDAKKYKEQNVQPHASVKFYSDEISKKLIKKVTRTLK